MSAPRRPGAGRPSAGRRPARTGTRTPRPAVPRAAGTPAPAAARKRVRSSPATARLAVLGLVVCTLVLSAALPLREFLSQRGEIAELEQSQAQAQARVAELEAEQRRLEDPAYVAAEARRRLHFVLPGETAYVVLQPEPAPDAGAPNSKSIGGATGPEAPWWSQVWGSVHSADRPSS